MNAARRGLNRPTWLTEAIRRFIPVVVAACWLVVAGEARSNADLQSLTINDGSLVPAFASEVTTYGGRVAPDATQFTVTATPADSNATLMVNGEAATAGQPAGPFPVPPFGALAVEVKVTAADDSSTKSYLVSVRRSATNADLGGLTLSVGELSPQFSAETTAYMTSVGAATASVTVTATADDSNATLKLNGATITSGQASPPQNLDSNPKILTVEVTAEDGTTKKSYVITVNRLSNDSSLASLTSTVGTLSPEFVTTTFDYGLSVPSATTSVSLTPTTGEPNATMKLNGVDAVSGQSIPIILPVSGVFIATFEVTAQDGETKSTYGVNIRRISSDASLASLAVSTGALSPQFDSDVVSYTVNVSDSTESIRVTAAPTADNSTMELNGATLTANQQSDPIVLTEPQTTLMIVVTAEDDTQKTYAIAVNKLSSNAFLSGLTVSGGPLSPAFDKNTTAYNVIVPTNTQSVTLTPTAEDETATITVNSTLVQSGSPSPDLSFANNNDNLLAEVTVTAGDQSTTRTYTVQVHRTSSDASLQSLAVSAGSLSPNFSASTFSYSVDVPDSTQSIQVTASPNDDNATMELNGTELTAGQASNPINLSQSTTMLTLEVTAEDQAKQTYTIQVNKLSSNAFLSGLTVSGGSLNPVFDKNVDTYTVQVPNATQSVVVTPTAEDDGATITVNDQVVESGSASPALTFPNNSDNLVADVKVVSTDQSTTRTYTVQVRKTSSDASLQSLAVSVGSLAPNFNVSTFSYSVDVPDGTESIRVTASPSDDNATMKLNGADLTAGQASSPVALSQPTTTLAVMVTAEDQATQTYTIEVNKLSSNAFLSNLTVSGGSLNPVFDKNVNTYTVQVPTATQSVTVTPTAEDDTATITVNDQAVQSGSASPALTFPNNSDNLVADVKVTAGDQSTTRTYTVQVRKTSSDASLQSLSVSVGSLSPNFSAGTFSYSVEVPDSTESIRVTASPTDDSATMKLNGSDLTAGQASSPVNLSQSTTTLNLVVTAEDQATQTYTIEVNKLSSNASLESLVVSSGSLMPAFSPDQLTYDVEVSNATENITVTATAAPGATIQLNDTDIPSGQPSPEVPLNVGVTPLDIVVTAEDGSKKMYMLRAKRLSNNALLNSLTVSAGVLDPEFSAQQTDYSVTVPGTTQSISITASTQDDGATMKLNGQDLANNQASSPVALSPGTTTLNLVVSAEDGNQATYAIRVNRLSSNAFLSDLVPSSGALDPAFSKNTLAYEAIVPAETASVNVTPTAEDDSAAITVNGVVVKSGEPGPSLSFPPNGGISLEVKVVSADESVTRTYSVTFQRSSEETLRFTEVSVSNGMLMLRWTGEGTLQSSSDLIGWENIQTSGNAYNTPADVALYYRLIK